MQRDVKRRLTSVPGQLRTYPSPNPTLTLPRAATFAVAQMLILIQHDNVLDEGEKTFQTYLRKIEVRKDLMGFKSLFLLSQKANFNLVLAVSQD